jgi:hypothetical protein
MSNNHRTSPRAHAGAANANGISLPFIRRREAAGCTPCPTRYGMVR